MTLTIKDLPASKELDRAAMSAVRGGFFGPDYLNADAEHTQEPSPGTTTGTNTSTQRSPQPFTQMGNQTTSATLIGATLDITKAPRGL